MLARTHVSPCAIIGLGAALLLVLGGELAPPCAAPEAAVVDAELTAPATHSDPLRGLWMRHEAAAEGDPMRFWYFHGDGKGIYRYGRVGLTNTHSFDYEVDGAGSRVDLRMRFRKHDESHAVSALLEQDERGRTWMILRGDPREPGARYLRVDADADFTAHAPQAAGDEVEVARAALGDRIWIDYTNYATGGSGFHLYQFAKTSLDGRGIGWFHRGDFDEWSTESLTYRISGDQIELYFDLREEPTSTRFRLVEGEEGRELWLDADPRDFWAPHRYKDGGKSFDSAAFDMISGLDPYLASGK